MKFKTEKEFIEYVDMMQRQNLKDRNTPKEDFIQGIEACLEELKDLNLFSIPVVSNNGDKHLEEINDIMWNSLMIKGRDFGRKEGFKIMQVLEEWSTPK